MGTRTKPLGPALPETGRAPTKADRARTVSAVKVVLDLDHAAGLSKYRVHVTGRLGDRISGRLLDRLPPHLLSELRDLLGHLNLVQFVPRRLLRADCVMVRGCRTKMLALAAPFLWPFRRRIIFLAHQNVQYAHKDRGERIFVLLCRIGFRFGLLEGADGLAELGLEPRDDHFVTLPIPIREARAKPAADRASRPRVGVIGRALREKNVRDLARMLFAAKAEIDFDIVFASNSEAERAEWAARGVETRDSTDYRDYVRAVRSVDVLFVNYDPAFYYYRSSGVISDGAANGTAVVAPDFPVFRRQILSPVPVGALFTDESGVAGAIAEANHITRNRPANFSAWAEARSAEVFAERLDAFLDASLPRGRRRA